VNIIGRVTAEQITLTKQLAAIERKMSSTDAADARIRPLRIYWQARELLLAPILAVIGFWPSWPSLSPAGAIEQRAFRKN
jgi:hypothetical protein